MKLKHVKGYKELIRKISSKYNSTMFNAGYSVGKSVLKLNKTMNTTSYASGKLLGSFVGKTIFKSGNSVSNSDFSFTNKQRNTWMNAGVAKTITK